MDVEVGNRLPSMWPVIDANVVTIGLKFLLKRSLGLMQER
jgi:hypothetical protein